MENKRDLNFSPKFKPDESWTANEVKEAVRIFETISREKILKLVKENGIRFSSDSVLDNTDDDELIDIIFSDVSKEKLLSQLRELSA